MAIKTDLEAFRGSCETTAPSCFPLLKSFEIAVAAIRFILVALMLCLPGCAHSGLGRYGTAQAPLTNPLRVASNNEELVWERAVDVLHDYQFEIVRENRIGRVIETAPKIGAGLFEPWHRDSVGFTNRLESSLQSIRRTVFLSLQPDDLGQSYLVSVEVRKEIEDVGGANGNSPGASTFSESTPLIRDLDTVVGQDGRSRWLLMGRDYDLEQAILHRLYAVYSW